MEAVIVPSVRGILSKLVAVQDQGQLNCMYEVNYVQTLPCPAMSASLVKLCSVLYMLNLWHNYVISKVLFLLMMTVLT